MVWPELEKEFSETCKILLGEELKGLEDYGPWLGKRVSLPYCLRSAISGKNTWMSPPLNYIGKRFAKTKAISYDEMDLVNKTQFKYEDIANSDVKDIVERIIKPVAYIVGNFRYGNYENVEKCSGAGAGRNLYYGEDLYMDIKNAAYSNYTMFSINMFGCHNAPYSSFCIHTYNSVNVSRCFEVDGCSKCSDLLFCHNCEGVSDSLLCFNAKNLRHAVGNVELGRENYQKVKKILLDRVVKELKEKKNSDIDIYNVGCR